MATANEKQKENKPTEYFFGCCPICRTTLVQANEKHPMPDTSDDFVGDDKEGMFGFKKQMLL